MKYYKLISGQTFIGIANSNDFVAQNPINHWLLTANEITGQYVECNNVLYRDYWMSAVNNTNLPEFTYVNIQEIDHDEYSIYEQAIEKNEEIIVPDPHHSDMDPIPPDEEVEEPSVEFIRSSKLSEMSYECRKAIENGIDIEVKGEKRHFSFTTQDQLNLMSLSTMAQTSDIIPYHADGEQCIYYTAAEINTIIAAMNKYKIYHTTYYNALKAYINSLETIEEISAITYGTPIPDEYKTEVLKVIGQ